MQWYIVYYVVQCIIIMMNHSISDINECLNDPCHANATCMNTLGSFTCACDDNFSGDGFNCTRICENGFQLNKSSMACGMSCYI